MMTQMSPDENIKSILEDRARKLAGEGDAESVERDVLQLIAFSMGEERFGVEMQYIQEIQPLTPGMWSLVPCTPDFIVGAVNIRGRIYSIMNMAAYLKIAVDVHMETAHVLLIRGETGPDGAVMEFCILADSRPKLERIPQSSVQPATGTLSAKGQEFIQGVTSDMLMILDLEKLISHPGIIVMEETV